MLWCVIAYTPALIAADTLQNSPLTGFSGILKRLPLVALRAELFLPIIPVPCVINTSHRTQSRASLPCRIRNWTMAQAEYGAWIAII
ncbi:MAG: hypothetical protein R3F37_02215 [Candidatus Competibacteraceae bacterium]